MTTKEVAAADFYCQSSVVMMSCGTFDSTQCESIEKESSSSSELSSSEDDSSSSSTVANFEDGDDDDDSYDNTDPSPSTARATAAAPGDSFAEKGKKKMTAARILRRRIAKRSLSSVFRGGNKDRDGRDVWLRRPSPSKEWAVTVTKNGNKRRTSLADLFPPSVVGARSGGTGRKNRHTTASSSRSLSAPSLSSSRMAKEALLDARGTPPYDGGNGGNERSESTSKSISKPKPKPNERHMIDMPPPSSDGTESGSDVAEEEEGGCCADDAAAEVSSLPLRRRHRKKAKAKERRDQRRGKKKKKYGRYRRVLVRRSSVGTLLGRMVPGTAAIEDASGACEGDVGGCGGDGDVAIIGDGDAVAIEGDGSTHPEQISGVVTMPPPLRVAVEPLPPDSTLERMNPLLEGTLRGVSVRGFYDACWSQRGQGGPCSFGSWLRKRGNHDVCVGDWETCSSEEKKSGAARDFVNEWCGESYAQKRTVSFRCKRTTHLYTGPPMADVSHTHHCRVEGTGAGDRCVVAMTIRMGGIPYADTFRVHIRWVASRAGATDLSVRVGVFIEFTKSCMFARQIRSGTMETTKAAQMDLFKNIRRGFCSPCSDVGGAGSDNHDDEVKATEHIPAGVEACHTGSGPRKVKVVGVGTSRGTYLKACLILLAGSFFVLPSCFCWLRHNCAHTIFCRQLGAPTMDDAVVNAQSATQALRSLLLSVQDLRAEDKQFTQQRKIFLGEIEEMQETMMHMHNLLAQA